MPQAIITMDILVQHNERSGQLFALAGFAVLSCGDAVFKTMAGEASVIAVAAIRFILGAVMLSLLLALREGAGAFWPRSPWLQFARGAGVAFASLFFFSAIFVMPLAETMAITFVAPILTALLSGPLLGERVRRHVYLASFAALAGVLLILRPNFEEYGLIAILPLGAAVCFSLVVIANRASAGQGSALSMQVYMSVVSAVILSLAAIAGHFSGLSALQVSVPDGTIFARCLAVACLASTAHYLIFVGTQRAGASAVSPMSYVQMVVATLLGWLLFGDLPDTMTYLGVAVIIASGLYLWTSGKATSQQVI